MPEIISVTKWHERYELRLMAVAGLSLGEAQDSLMAGMGNYDYSEKPEDEADEEMAYWTNDG